jgi:hypothetical protein
VNCPAAVEIAALVDGELAESRARDIRAHAVACAQCRASIAACEKVIEDLRTPMAGVLGEKSPEAFADAVLAGLDRPRGDASRWAGWRLALGPLLAAAVVVVAFGLVWRRSAVQGEWTARGGRAHDEPVRNVLLRFGRVPGGAFDVLGDGARIGRHDVLAAEVGRTGHRQLFLLAFLVDALGERHWIYPAYEVGAAPPSSEPLPLADSPRLLSTMTRLEDLAPGPARIVAIVLPASETVEYVEAAPVAELAQEKLAAHYPRALVVATNVLVGD